MEIVRRLCPRVTVMIAGRVAAEGPLDEVARREDVITAYLGRAACMSSDAILAVEDLHAGYLPGVDILRGLTLIAPRPTPSRW